VGLLHFWFRYSGNPGEEKIDAFLGFPPDPQALRTQQIGHVLLNSALDRPWSQYFQIPPDFVVKHQVIDIVDVIFPLIWRRNLVKPCGRNPKSRCESLAPSAAHPFTT
jgi:hypothetical protein